METYIKRKNGNGNKNGGRYNTLPPQNVPLTTKQTPKWQHACIDAIISMASYQSSHGRSPRKNKIINYDMMNSRFKESDFKHILNPYNVSDTKFTNSQTKLQMYNIIRTKIEALKGEEMKLGLNFRAVAVNGDAVTERNAERQQMITEAIKAQTQAIVDGNIDPETGMPNAENPNEVAAQYDTEYEHPTEIASNQLLQFLVKHDNLQMKFSQGWEHALVVAEEIYYAGIYKGHPSIRTCNPLNVEFERESDNPFIHKGEWAREERMMPVGAVIDNYGKFLSKKDVKRLESGEYRGRSQMATGQEPGFAYDFNGGMRQDPSYNENGNFIEVTICTWRSTRRIGHYKYLSERTGKVESTVVGDTFKLTPEQIAKGDTLEWEYITDIWKGTRILDDIYCDVGSLENQTGDLPFVGYVYNNVNSIATSVVDMCKAHQYTYIIVWYRLEQEIAKAKGKKFIMDVAQLPKSKGWTVDQWMYYFDEMGVAWINSMEEGRKGDKNSRASFNQFKSIDMSLSQTIGQYMEILRKLEEQVETITGVNKQREGDIGRNETSSGAHRAITQSLNNTRPLFFYHDIVRKDVLQYLMELAKVAYIDGTSIEHIVDERSRTTIKLNAGVLNTTDLGVFMTNTFDEAETIEKLEGFLGLAMQSNIASLEDAVSVLGSKSISEIKSQVVKSERERNKREADGAEAQRKSSEAIAAEQKATDERKIDTDIYKAELTAATSKEVALIQAGASESDADKVLKETKADVEKAKSQLDVKKQKSDEQAKKRELDLKAKELTIKKKEASNKSKSAT